MNEDQNIPKLPAEIIVHISTYLNIRDKFKLRLINKEFKTTFDHLIKLDQLIIDRDLAEFNWFYTNRKINEIDLIYTKIISDDLFKRNLFLNLKKLSFHHHKAINFKETINQLKYLEELNIKCLVNSNSILSLPKLKILTIEQSKYLKCKIELETPLLSILRCDNLGYYQFNYPKKIIYFDTKLINNDKLIVTDLNNQIQQFENLEYLILYHKSFKRLKPISITKLNQLKELHFYKNVIYTQELIKIKEFYELKLRLKLNNLRIFFYGIDYENLKELNAPQLSNQLDLIFSNYSNTIDIIPFVVTIDFDKLFKFLNSNPNVSLDNVIYKFPNIHRIRAYHVDNDNIDFFFQFLSKYDHLKVLHLELLSIENQIYYLNKLPDLCKRIKQLYLHNLNVNESTNLDFLFKFKELSSLDLGKFDDLNILEKLQTINLDAVIYCKFIFYDQIFKIQYHHNKYKYGSKKYRSTFDLIKHFYYEINHHDSNDSCNSIEMLLMFKLFLVILLIVGSKFFA